MCTLSAAVLCTCACRVLWMMAEAPGATGHRLSGGSKQASQTETGIGPSDYERVKG